MSKSFIVFDIWGQLAHFRKIYTTSSPQSYAFPSRTTISGMIGAILGLEKSRNPGKNESYTKNFKASDTDIGIQIVKPIKKIRVNINHVDTKRNWRLEKGNRTQIRAEFVKSPRYRIYVSFSDEDMHLKLKNRLKNKRSYFTLSLGLSELLANFKYVGEYGGRRISEKNKVTVNNVIPYSKGRNIEIEEGDMVQRDVFPGEMNSCRVVTKRKELIFKSSWQEGNSQFKLTTKGFYALDNNENIFIL